MDYQIIRPIDYSLINKHASVLLSFGLLLEHSYENSSPSELKLPVGKFEQIQSILNQYNIIAPSIKDSIFWVSHWVEIGDYIKKTEQVFTENSPKQNNKALGNQTNKT